MSGKAGGSLPEVSVVMPAHNAARYICASVDSVIGQTFSDWELLIVDDSSTDGTAELVRHKYVADRRISVIQLSTNSGAAIARNTAIEQAKGRFIAFLDCDDLWLPEKLARQIEYMKERSVPFTFTAYERVTPEGRIIGAVGVPAKTSYSEMLKTSVIGCSTAVYDTEYFGKVFMPVIRMRQDYALWLALLKRVQYGFGLNSVLVRYNVRPGSISSNKRRAALYTWRVYRYVEKLSLPKATWCFANYSFRGFIRYRFPRLAKAIRLMQ